MRFGEGRRTSHRFDRRCARKETLSCHLTDAAPPRPPFTLTATLFGALRTSLFEARMLPADFYNYLRRTDEWIRGSRFLAGTVAMTTFLF